MPVGGRIKRGENVTGRSLLLPGVNSMEVSLYPAFWTRDPAWVAEGGLVPADDVWGWITLLSETMHGAKQWHLASGGVVLPYSLPDHVNLDGQPVYYPGTYASDATQGGGKWGKYPPHDDQYWLTFSAFAHVQLTGDPNSFQRTVKTRVGEMPLSAACELTHGAFPVDPETQLCVASGDLAEHIVDWGYNDSISKTGKLLFPSLLRFASATQLADLFARIGQAETAAHYAAQVATLRASITKTFLVDAAAGGQWLLSATGIGRKPDVWGSAYAVYLGAVDDAVAREISRALRDAYVQRTAVLDGQVRHVLLTDGGWDVALCAEGTYQNGAYWGYPIGWYVYSLSLVDPDAARRLYAEYMVAMTRDWEKGLGSFAWEWINPALGHFQSPGYLTTVALPYVTLKAKWML